MKASGMKAPEVQSAEVLCIKYTVSECSQFSEDICPEAKALILHLLPFNCDVSNLSFQAINS